MNLLHNVETEGESSGSPFLAANFDIVGIRKADNPTKNVRSQQTF
jgi:hypothetical protein